MPITVMLERKGLEKFKLSSLGLDIKANGSAAHEDRKYVWIYCTPDPLNPYYVVHDRHTTIHLAHKRKGPIDPKTGNQKMVPYDLTTSALARLIAASQFDPHEFNEKIANREVIRLFTKSYQFDNAVYTGLFSQKHGLGSVSKYVGDEIADLPMTKSFCKILGEATV